ncbi:MAG: glycoside hydrolase family 2 protein [Armatimonadetes bacterium]|nr:glycoside hydrolase family 2 protein [Armatimonadota bacterium]
MIFAQTLDGAWKLRRVGSKSAFKAHVPGSVHLDLMRAKKIEDPFVGDNEFAVSWVHECDWEYSRTFEADPELLKGNRIFLECEGLDTFAQISLNGAPLGATDNMYVSHRFDVSKKLIPGQNELKITFQSPVNYVKPLLEQDPLHSPGDSLPGASYTRKSPSQWGWDWGPKLPTSGIWKPIRLAAYSIARIDDIRVQQKHGRSGSVALDVLVTLERYKRTSCGIEITLTHPDGHVEAKHCKAIGANAKRSINIDKPELWWPNGYGDQPLYTLEASIICDDRPLGTLKRRIGLRTIRLEQRKDNHGRSFTFIVNGVKLFCKGADWIPADQFPARVTEEHYRHLISSAAKANMNMLRVWGGGIYENDVFYDLCDEYGVLIWQDFMFACSMYPVNKEFLANVERDVGHNIVRLRDHACLALWCGNNEMEWFLADRWGGDKNALRRKQYSKIFHELIPSIVNKLDPATAYWPSSPASHQPFDKPNDQSSGDGHYWDVWHGRLPFTAYRTQYHRFMSEFGFESLPSYETCKAFAGGDDLNITSYVMERHQKNSAGNGLILHYLAQTFRMPKNFEMMCYVSQLLQAEAMRYGVEHWRRHRGRCMGALYWQFNDCWPVCSWSSIDYYGRWKALNYAAKRFYSPIMLSVCEEGAHAQIHVTNDTTEAAKIEVRWSLERLDGKVIRKSKIKTIIDAEQSKNLADLDFSDDLIDDDIRQAVLVHELLVNGKHASIGMTSFVPSKHLDLPATKIMVKPKTDENGAYLEVTSEKTARFVWLAIPRHDVIFSDNYFDLPAGRKVIVRIDGAVSPSALSKVKAFSLRDSY